MTKVPFGAFRVPFLVAVTLRHHFQLVEDKYPSTAKLLKDHFYVDDFVIGAQSKEEAQQVVSDCSRILKEARMHLTKWTTSGGQLQNFNNTKGSNIQFGVEYKKEILGFVFYTDKDILKPTATKVLESLSEQKVTERHLKFSPLTHVRSFLTLSAVRSGSQVIYTNSVVKEKRLGWATS